MRRIAFAALSCLGAGALCAPSARSPDDLARARRIHAEAIGIDSHIDTLQRVLIGHEDITRRTDRGHVDLPRLREAGVRAPFFALYVPTYYRGAEAVRRTLQLRDAMQRLLDANPAQLELALSAADVERIVRAGRIAAVLTIESGHAIADDLAVLRMYHRLGVRSMTLTHFRNTNWADSSTDTPQHDGLSEIGRAVVREMERLGMIVDISHVSDKTFHDTLAVATKPVIASHSSCRALADVPRNMTDEMIRALARQGGVIGINFGAGFLSAKEAEQARRRFAARDYLDTYTVMRPNQATLADAVAHIDHVVKLVGADHVGIGSDWDGINAVPAGLEDVSRLPSLTAALLERGYSDTDVKKILGGNMLRVMRQVIGR